MKKFHSLNVALGVMTMIAGSALFSTGACADPAADQALIFQKIQAALPLATYNNGKLLNPISYQNESVTTSFPAGTACEVVSWSQGNLYNALIAVRLAPTSTTYVPVSEFYLFKSDAAASDSDTQVKSDVGANQDHGLFVVTNNESAISHGKTETIEYYLSIDTDHPLVMMPLNTFGSSDQTVICTGFSK